MEAAGAVDATNAPTAPWKTAQNAVFHSYHRHSSRELKVNKCYPCSRLTSLPMFPAVHGRSTRGPATPHACSWGAAPSPSLQITDALRRRRSSWRGRYKGTN